MRSCTSTGLELLIDMDWSQGADRLEWKLYFQKFLDRYTDPSNIDMTWNVSPRASYFPMACPAPILDP